MKLNAPPPPPPETPEPSGSGQPNPNEPTPPNEPTLPTQTIVPAAAPKLATWPAWFVGADYLLVALTLTLAFLVSSFIARNPDLWLHLAAGKRLLAGEYWPGSDPFSYSAADRAWVNHSLLYDVGSYLLYGGDGVVLVVAKAAAVVLTFGLLLAIRCQGFAFWPWAVVSGIAILAAAPRVYLSPLVGSMMFLALTLFLLFRMPQRPGSWRFPIAIGVTFWLWALVDSWFFLGPLALALVLLGELIQARFRQSLPSEAEPGGDPLGTVPDVRTLSRALAIGLLACMLNPHHVRIWELPFELVGANSASLDPRIRIFFLLTPLDKDYLDRTAVGKNLNGLAFATLFVGGAVIIGLGFGRLRIAHLTLWVGFASIAILSVFAIPFFAIIAVPLISAQLNAYSSWARLTTWGNPQTRLLLLGSSVGRVVTLILLMTACIMAWPGWMQPESQNLAFNRRVAWGIEPDEELKHVALQLQNWRESGKLPPETRGVICSIELANYCAWFAPLEKVYINGNYCHHRAELPKFVALRSSFGFFIRGEPNAKQVDEAFENIGADYLVCAASQNEAPLQRIAPTFYSWSVWGEYEHWSPWYLDGRAAIGGWKAKPNAHSQALDSIKFDPLELAFGPGVDPLPPGAVKQIPALEGWEGEFLHGVGFCPPQADEAIMWSSYRESIQNKFLTKLGIESLGRGLSLFSSAPSTLTHHQLLMDLIISRLTPRRSQPESLPAFPFLALRAARRAIAADPNHPDAYFALFEALKDPGLPISESERILGQVTALRQCLSRLPPPEEFRQNNYFARPVAVARSLALLYYGHGMGQQPVGMVGLPIDLPAFRILLENPWREGVMVAVQEDAKGPDGQIMSSLHPIPARERRQNQQVRSGPCLRPIDMAHEMAILAIKYAERDPQLDGKELEQLKAMVKQFESDLSKCSQDFLREKLGRTVKLYDQVKLALRNNLVKEALRLMRETPDLEKDFETNLVEIVFVRIALELATGRLEDAASDLDDAQKIVDSGPIPTNVPRERVQQFRASREGQLQALKYQKYLSEGNYRAAGEIIENEMTPLGEKDPPLSSFETAMNTTAFLKLPLISQVISHFSGLNPLDTMARQGLVSSLTLAFTARQQLLHERRTLLSRQFYQRGLLSLIEGDTPNAKLRFEQSRMKGVPEWGVPDQRNAEAEQYLHLIELAEKRSKK